MVGVEYAPGDAVLAQGQPGEVVGYPDMPWGRVNVWFPAVNRTLTLTFEDLAPREPFQRPAFAGRPRSSSFTPPRPRR